MISLTFKPVDVLIECEGVFQHHVTHEVHPSIGGEGWTIHVCAPSAACRMLGVHSTGRRAVGITTISISASSRRIVLSFQYDDVHLLIRVARLARAGVLSSALRRALHSVPNIPEWN